MVGCTKPVDVEIVDWVKMETDRLTAIESHTSFSLICRDVEYGLDERVLCHQPQSARFRSHLSSPITLLPAKAT